MAGASNFSAISTALKALLETVTGIGMVHESQRLTRDWSTFIQQFTKDGKVNGVTISRRSSPEDWHTNMESVRKHVFVIRLMYGVQEEANPHTEVTFQQLVELVADAFRADYDLGETCEIHTPANVRVVDYRLFGGVLCHYAEIEITAQELLLSGGN